MYKEIVERLTELNKTIATMESCTGGAVVNEITNIEGSSNVLKFSAITYSNDYKIKMGVEKEIIKTYTVYSMETAKEMSKKISDYANSDYGIGVTGKLNKADDNNPYGEDDSVFISIYDKEKNTYYEEFIKVVDETRELSKKQIVDIIGKKLLEIIS